MTRHIQDAIDLYQALAEEMRHPIFVMQTLTENRDGETAHALRRFVVLCRQTRSTVSGAAGKELRAALKRVDRERRSA